MTATMIQKPTRLTAEDIVDVCTRHAQASRFRNVSMNELSEVTGASERRVRDAFYQRLGTAPTTYLRTTALHEARRLLLDGPRERDAVTRTATDLGFSHLSRFAAQYRALFGESPSATVARARSAAESG